MRKEAINTFQEGLNYDLNPITTPNNVLTDCVNGTFITFNGDELALQNDAGNTKILIPGTNNYVKLSSGFYPLGIKEYGGVLYIVSGSKVQIDDSITNWNINTVYEIGQIVRFNNKFYINGIENNTNPIIDSDLLIGEIDSEILLMEDGSQSLAENGWTEVILDSGNYLNLVEFGSYPSPKYAGSTDYKGLIYETNSKIISSSLYNTKVINKEDFTSGSYIKFLPNNVDTSNVSYYSTSDVYVAKFYKIKLYHQLNNGFLDLTEDVWKKYLEFKTTITNPNNHWFNESRFIYFCPNQYKGKLAISVEIEELSSFKLTKTPELIYDNKKEYNVVNVEDTSSFNPRGIILLGDLSVDYSYFSYTSKSDKTFISSTYNKITTDAQKGSSVKQAAITSLSSNVTGTITSIPVSSTSGFASSGRLILISETSTEYFNYTSITATSFEGLSQTFTGTYLSSHSIFGPSTNTALTTTTVDIEDRYIYNFEIEARGTGQVTIPSIVIDVYKDNVLEFSEIRTSESGIYYATLVFDSDDYKEAIINYKIYPNLSAVASSAETSDFPKEYRDLYQITGLRLINTILDELKFKLDIGACRSDKSGIKEYTQVALIDANGNYINHLFEISDKKHVFLKEGATLEEGAIEIGKYTVTAEGYPTVTSYIEGVSESIRQMFESTLVNVIDPDCLKVSMTVTTTIPLVNQSDIKVYQSGELLSLSSQSNLNTFTFDVSPNINFRIIISRDGFMTIDDSNSISHAFTFNYALIANPELEVSVVDSMFYNFVGRWGGYQISGINSIDFLATVSQSGTYREGTMTVQGDRNTYYGLTSNIKKSSIKYIGATLKILRGSELSIPTEGYANIDNISKSLFTTINGVIFFKETFYDLAIPYNTGRDGEIVEY